MAYLSIKDFQSGLDRRRARVAGTPGTLWDARNVHVTRGKSLERARAFVPTYTLPAGTHGLAETGRQLYTFGSEDLAASMPLGVLYQRLEAPAAPAMVRVLKVEKFDAKFYVIAEYDDGGVYAFYDGVRIVGWDTHAAASATLGGVARILARKVGTDPTVTAFASGMTVRVTARAPGTPFSISTATVNAAGGTDDQTLAVTQVQANVVAVTEVRAVAEFAVVFGTDAGVGGDITSVLADVTELLDHPVPWRESNETAAVDVAAAINGNQDGHDYFAEADGATVRIHAPIGAGAAANGDALAVTVINDVEVSPPATTFAGGVDAVEADRQVEDIVVSGTIDAGDQWSVTVDGRSYLTLTQASGMSTFAWTHKRRVWALAGSLVRYSVLNDPDDVTTESPSVGSGRLNLSNESSGTEDLVAAETFNGQAAFFSRRSVQIWNLDTDDVNNAIVQTVGRTGTIAPRSVIDYGNTDVFYLATTGIRSLRGRSTTDAAYASDLGLHIDTFVAEHLQTLNPAEIERAVAEIEPRDGRFWLAIGERIYVLSFYPEVKVSAWTYYEPGFVVSDLVVVGDFMYVRAADTVYLYGGETGDTYPDADETPAVVEIPFLDGDRPGHKKDLFGFDIACEGEWRVNLLIDPNNTGKHVPLGVYHQATYHQPGNAAFAHTSHFALQLTCRSAGRAALESLAVHYELEDSPE